MAVGEIFDPETGVLPEVWTNQEDRRRNFTVYTSAEAEPSPEQNRIESLMGKLRKAGVPESGVEKARAVLSRAALTDDSPEALGREVSRLQRDGKQWSIRNRRKIAGVGLAALFVGLIALYNERR